MVGNAFIICIRYKLLTSSCHQLYLFSDEVSSYLGSKTECDVQERDDDVVLESEDAEENVCYLINDFLSDLDS